MKLTDQTNGEAAIMDLKVKVKQVLERLEVESPQVNIEPGNSYRAVFEVVSPSFEAMSEGERQRLVWSKILDELDGNEQEVIDTVFTNSPREHEDVMAGSAPLATDTEA